MPNWCECTLTLTGDEARLRLFHTENYVDCPPDKHYFAFEVAYPDYDQHVHRMRELTYREGREGQESGSGALTYEFLFAWAPPKDWITRAAKRYPDIRFDIQYEEVSMCFRGKYVVQGNTVLEDVVHDTSGWTPEMYGASRAFVAQEQPSDATTPGAALRKIATSVVGVKLDLLDAAAAAGNKAPESEPQRA